MTQEMSQTAPHHVTDAYLTQEILQSTFNEFAQRLSGVDRDLLHSTFADLVSAISGPYTAALREAITKEVNNRLRYDQEAGQMQILHQAHLHAVQTNHGLALQVIRVEVSELENSLQEAINDNERELQIIRDEVESAFTTQDDIIAGLETKVIILRGELEDFHASTVLNLETITNRWGIGSGNHVNVQSQTENQSEYGELPHLIPNTDRHDQFQLPLAPERATDSRGSTVVDGGDDEAYNVNIGYSPDAGEDIPSPSEFDQYLTSAISYGGRNYVNSSTSMSED